MSIDYCIGGRLMRKLTVLYLEGCPYCRNARAASEELLKENPGFSEIQIDWIEERHLASIANNYDYYYVPSIFYGTRKLYECKPDDDFSTIKQQFRNAMESVIDD